MKKKQFRELLRRLPETVDEVNDLLDDEMFYMIDYVDGERILNIRVYQKRLVSNGYVLITPNGGENGPIDRDYILRCSVLK